MSAYIIKDDELNQLFTNYMQLAASAENRIGSEGEAGAWSQAEEAYKTFENRQSEKTAEAMIEAEAASQVTHKDVGKLAAANESKYRSSSYNRQRLEMFRYADQVWSGQRPRPENRIPEGF